MPPSGVGQGSPLRPPLGPHAQYKPDGKPRAPMTGGPPPGTKVGIHSLRLCWVFKNKFEWWRYSIHASDEFIADAPTITVTWYNGTYEDRFSVPIGQCGGHNTSLVQKEAAHESRCMSCGSMASHDEPKVWVVSGKLLGFRHIKYSSI